MDRNSNSALRITGAYVLIAALWISFSDTLLEAFTTDETLITRLQTFKGFAFVLVTGAVLFFLLRRELRLRDALWAIHEKEKNELLMRLEIKNQELIKAYDATIEGWSKALELRDREVKDHSSRVTGLAILLARAFHFTEDQIIQIRRGAMLHDIGKMAIPDSVLLKEGPLNPDERQVIQRHIEYGIEMLSKIRFLEPALDVLRYHHEKWNGAGYPFNLREDQIPLSARIFAVVDVWDALTSDRPYRQALPTSEALQIIQSQSGVHFDPLVIDKFMTLGLYKQSLVLDDVSLAV